MALKLQNRLREYKLSRKTGEVHQKMHDVDLLSRKNEILDLEIEEMKMKILDLERKIREKKLKENEEYSRNRRSLYSNSTK